MRYGSIVVAALLIGGGAAAAYWFKAGTTQQADGQSSGKGGRRGNRGGATAPVSVSNVKKQSVPVYREGIGNVQALNAVTVRAQVDGRLLSVEFKEGEDVKKGDVLARIDPALYKALYDQAVAKKAQDEATLGNAKLDLDRYRKLAENNAGPKQQADQQAATVAQLTAQIAADQGAIDNAKATLDYTTVVSPLDGRIGLRQVDPGNIVHASDSTGIVSITQLKPIAVVFTLPQRDLDATAAAFAKGKVVVEIPKDDGTVLTSGTLLSLDNQIDVTTGTIKLKATFDNDNLILWPGQFVTVRAVVDTLADAKVVPSSSVRRGTNGTYVYTVSQDMTAVVTPVTVALQDDNIAVISKGLDFDQQIITEGFAQLTDGKAIEISTPDTQGAPAPGAARKGKRTKDQGQNGAANTAPAAGTPEPSKAAIADPANPSAADAAPADKPADASQKRRHRKDQSGKDQSGESGTSPRKEAENNVGHPEGSTGARP